MSRLALHFPILAKVILYGIVLLSLGSGSLWWILDRWGDVEGEFGLEKSPWLPLCLKIHGASAILASIGFGYLLATHIPIGWRSRRQRWLGLSLVALVVIMIVTGYGLYYIGDPDFRQIVSWGHRLSGVSLLPLILIHATIGARRSRGRALSPGRVGVG